ncbi:MAG TPA: hypothetical protein VFQ43_11090 [Nitrososphaera sp.]|nr:hypothetical protein [Nitrososphaera sp.]
MDTAASPKVYYIYSPTDSTVLLGLNLKIRNKTISWFDTVKERIMTAKELKETDQGCIDFVREESEGGESYTCIPLTLQLYREKVKVKLLAPKEFDSEKEMIRAFYKTLEDAW